MQEEKKRADNALQQGTEDILAQIEVELNEKMKEINDTLFEDRRKAPELHFKSYDSYKFETPNDTGTGSNYKGMLVYDLAILHCTALPAIAHDSLLFKNLGDYAVNGLMKIYEKSEKQVFVAFDRQNTYMKDTQQILERNKVLKLSIDGDALYGKAWNKEE